MNKTAIVLGATGLIGSHLVQQLVECSDYEIIIAITRRPIDYDSNKIRNVVVDFEQLGQHKDSIQGDVLFSCLGTTLKQAGSIEAQRKVDYDYQLAMAKMACENGVMNYVLVSSSGANANSLSPYLKMKAELEQAVSQLAFSNISFVQPSLLLGQRPESRMAEGIGAVILPALCKLPGLQKYAPIQGWQVAKKMVELSLEHFDSVKSSRRIQTISLADVFPNS